MNSNNHLNKFTITNNDETEKHISKDLNNIKKILLSSKLNIIGIHLVGGFGRGEGSALKLNKKIYIINDYDLIVIHDDEIEIKEKNKIQNKLKQKISIKQIDITYYYIKELKKLKNTIYNYDFKYYSKILYQKNNYLNLIPNFKKKFKIGEALLPLEVYMSALILSIPKNYNFRNINSSQKFWIFHQISKSIIGWSMSDLIENNLYEPLYSKRLNELEKIYLNNNKSIKFELAELALNFKLNTYYDINLDVKKLWFQTKKIHLNMLIEKYFVFKKIRIPFFLYKFKIKNIIKLIYGMITQNKYYSNYSNLFLSKLYFLLSINENSNDKKNFYLCVKYCKKIGLDTKRELSAEFILEFLKKNDPNCQQFIETNDFF